MNAQIITIGDEILIGQVLDTNSAWLAVKLTKLGFTITQKHTIADNKQAIISAIDNALQINNLVILTGGLGPTKDDITKNTLCEYFKTELEFNAKVYTDVEAFLQQRGAKMNPLNRDQALFPAAAKVLQNRQGTAPGIWFEQNGKVLISLPGVPWEMKGIFNQVAKSKVESFFSLPEIYYQTVMITGMGESPLAIKLEKWENNLPKSIKLAYLPSPGIVRLRLGIKGEDSAILKNTVSIEVEKLHEIIPDNIFSDYEVSLQEIVGNLLKHNNKTVCAAESCTGGSISQLLTSISGSSTYFTGSIVAYLNQVKIDLLNVPESVINKFGAVSKEVVESMAIGARKNLKTDYAIATSGIAGPDGGTNEKPVGTVWIAVSSSDKTISKKFKFGKEREINIKRSSIAALNMLRQFLA